jgi:hypothetical protein
MGPLCSDVSNGVLYHHWIAFVRSHCKNAVSRTIVSILPLLPSSLTALPIHQRSNINKHAVGHTDSIFPTCTSICSCILECDDIFPSGVPRRLPPYKQRSDDDRSPPKHVSCMTWHWIISIPPPSQPGIHVQEGVAPRVAQTRSSEGVYYGVSPPFIPQVPPISIKSVRGRTMQRVSFPGYHTQLMKCPQGT